MDELVANLSRDELKNLIQVFDVQIAVVIILLAFFTRNIIAKVILKIFDLFIKKKEKPEESEMYAPIKNMYIFIAFYLAVRILPIPIRLSIIMTSLFKSALVIFATKIINSTLLAGDSKLFKGREKNQGKACKALQQAESVAAQRFPNIHSKTACRGFDSFCPCH